MIENVLFFLKFKNSVHYFYDYLTVRQGLEGLRETGYSAVPVISCRGEYLGSLSQGDFLWYLLENQNNPAALEAPLRILIRADFMPAVQVSVSFEEVLQAALHQNYVPVVDDRRIFIGIVTRQTLLRHFMDQEELPVSILLDAEQKETVKQALYQLF